MARITEKDLIAVVARINRTAGTPEKPYVKNEQTSRYEPQAGCYHLSGAYGGVSLHQMSNTPGCTGVRDVFGCGHVTKRDLYARMHAFLAGMEVTK